MMKKLGLYHRKLLRFLGLAFLDGFDISKVYLHTLPAKASNVSGSHFWNTYNMQKIILGEISL